MQPRFISGSPSDEILGEPSMVGGLDYSRALRGSLVTVSFALHREASPQVSRQEF